MATQSDTRTLVRQAISQSDPSTSDFSDAEINGFIDQGVRFMGALVKKPIKRTSFQVATGIASYALATYAPDLIIPTKAYFGDINTTGDVRPIRILPEEELAEISPSWLDATAFGFDRPNYLIRDGANLVLAPAPSAAQAVTGKKAYISYVYQPAASSDAVALDLPIVYHDLVKDYAVHLCYLGKLNNIQQAIAIKGKIEKDAKRLEGLIVKESESPGFYWGSSVDPEDETFATAS